MKQNRLKKLLAAEAVICLLTAGGLWLLEGTALSLFDLPAGAVGRALTTLAASGRFGFALALTCYAFLVLLPLYVLVWEKARRKLAREDALLVGISLASACALFPRGFVRYWETEISQAMFCRLAWQWLALALLVGWCVLRLLRRIGGSEWAALLAMFRALLGVCAAVFVLSACFAEPLELLSALSTLSRGNTALASADTTLGMLGGESGMTGSLLLSDTILVLRFFADALPALLAAVTALLARDVLDTISDGGLGGFTAQSAAGAHHFAAWCAKALRWSVLASLAVNVLQAIGANDLLNISISVELPVFELCFVLAALLGARLIEANAALRADNDLFI